MPKVSKVWNHFTKVNEAAVKCNICREQLNRSGSNTQTMRKHLLRAHQLDVSTSSADTESGSTSFREPDQPAVTELFNKKRNLEFDSPKAIEITSKIANFIASDMQPLNVVNDHGFRELLNYLEPR